MSNASPTVDRIPAPTRSGRAADHGSADDRTDPGADLSLLEVPRAVYRFFYSKRVGLFLILAMGFLTLLGVLFQQIPDEVRADAQSHAAWLDSVRPRYRGWTGALDKIGVFSVFSSIWFRVVTAGLTLSVVACTTHRTPALWRHATKPHVTVKETFFEHGRLHRTVESDLPADEAIAQLRHRLAADGYRLVESSDGPGLNLFADKHRFAPFGTVLAHAAFVVTLAGVLITSTFGYRNSSFAVPVGTRVEVGRNSGLAVEAVNFADSYHENGRPKDYVSDLVLYKNGQQVAAQQVRVNSPLRYGGYSFNQSYFGIAAQLSVTDAAGRSLYRSGVPLQWESPDGQMNYGKFTLPDQRLQVYVLTAGSGAKNAPLAPGQMRVEVYPEGGQEPLASQVVSQGKPSKVGDLLVTFERERPFTGLSVARDPGAWWVWIGAGMLVSGTCLTMFLRHQRLWVRVHPNGAGSTVRMASPDRMEVGFERHFRRYADAVGATDPAEHTDPAAGTDADADDTVNSGAGASDSATAVPTTERETQNA